MQTGERRMYFFRESVTFHYFYMSPFLVPYEGIFVSFVCFCYMVKSLNYKFNTNRFRVLQLFMSLSLSVTKSFLLGILSGAFM